jgi:hypothetical protein
MLSESVWVLYSEDRCHFAALLAASDLNEENRG